MSLSNPKGKSESKSESQRKTSKMTLSRCTLVVLTSLSLLVAAAPASRAAGERVRSSSRR